MRERPKCLYWILSILSVCSFLALVALTVCLYQFKTDSILLGIFSAWISIVSGLLFSSIVSLIVQIINDNTSQKDILHRKQLIRNREINLLSREMSMFLSYYHDNERYLLQKYKINDSLIDNKLDIDVISNNMKTLNKVYKKANSQNKAFIENYLLISDSIKEQYNKVIDLINKKRVEFDNINIDMNFQIFSKEELEVLNLIPLYVKDYNDNLYTCLENFVKIVNTYNLEINFDDNMWLSLIAVLLSDNIDLKD